MSYYINFISITICWMLIFIKHLIFHFWVKIKQLLNSFSMYLVSWPLFLKFEQSFALVCIIRHICSTWKVMRKFASKVRNVQSVKQASRISGCKLQTISSQFLCMYKYFTYICSKLGDLSKLRSTILWMEFSMNAY